MDRGDRDILEQLYPVGRERWIKVRYTDFDWCVKHLRYDRDTGLLGFEVMAIGVREEYVPQVSALQDLWDTVYGFLCDKVPDHVSNEVREIFMGKMDELKGQLIKFRDPGVVCGGEGDKMDTKKFVFESYRAISEHLGDITGTSDVSEQEGCRERWMECIDHHTGDRITPFITEIGSILSMLDRMGVPEGFRDKDFESRSGSWLEVIGEV